MCLLLLRVCSTYVVEVSATVTCGNMVLNHVKQFQEIPQVTES